MIVIYKTNDNNKVNLMMKQVAFWNGKMGTMDPEREISSSKFHIVLRYFKIM